MPCPGVVSFDERGIEARREQENLGMAQPAYYVTGVLAAIPRHLLLKRWGYYASRTAEGIETVMDPMIALIRRCSGYWTHPPVFPRENVGG